MVLQVCKVVPTVEEKSDEVDVCHIEPEKVPNQNYDKRLKGSGNQYSLM